MNEEDLSIENNLKDFRKSHNLSQEELANKLGISRQSIIALEQGKSMPSLPLVVTMCRFFNSSFEDIFNLGDQIKNDVEEMINNDINIKVINNAHGLNSNFEQADGRKETIMSNEMEPWRPFREMVSLRDAMDRLFEDSVITPKTGSSMMPKIDIRDKKDAVIVRAELPGVAEEDIDVEISENVMTISGERKEEKEKEEEGYYYKESHSGAFSRSFSLPSDVKGEKASADMKNGVLVVSIPKLEPKKATKIKVAKK